MWAGGDRRRNKGNDMSISSSLNAGVSGLNVHASKLATISDNIANSKTFGYKRVDTEFSSLVLTETGGAYTAGGARSSSYREVDARGPLVSTTNATDLAISGRGMLPVTTIGAVVNNPDNPPLRMTSTGSFRPDANGVLRTVSGLVLLGVKANPDGTIPTFSRDSSDGLEPVVLDPNAFVASPTNEVTLGMNLPASATQAGAAGTALNLPVEYFDNLGASATLQMVFTPTVPATGSSNAWTLEVNDSATPTASNPVATFALTFDDTRGAGGSLLSVTPTLPATFDAVTGKAAFSVAGGPMALDFGVPGAGSKITQLSAEFAPTGVTKNGSPTGSLAGVEVDENGFVKARYNTGFVRTIYQIPLADVPNLNGLRAEDNQSFTVSASSGSLYLWNAGDGPTGEVTAFSREQSSTDIAGELTALIETQRAYSSNAKVIQTVDEMLQETTNIKR